MTARRRWQVGAAAALVLVAGSAAAFLVSTRREVTTSSSEAYDAYRRGRENEEKLYHREAASAYAEALSKDPAFAMAMARLAVLSQEKDPARARALLEGACRFRETVSARERLLLDIYRKALIEKDRAAAEQLTAEYLAAYPKGAEGYQLRANQLMKTGRAKEAAEVFGKLLAVNPNYAIAYNNIGYYCIAQGDYARAEDNLKRYRFLAPDQANPFDSLGELYANTGRYEEAEENLKRALEIKPDFAPAVGHLGTVAVGRGDFARAALLFHQAAALSDEGSTSANFVIAEALCTADAGDRPAALALLDGSPLLSGEGSESAKGLREVARIVRSGITGEPAPVLPDPPPAEAGRGADSGARKLALDLLDAIAAARKGDLAPGRSLVEKELPPWSARHGEFGYYPHFPMLWTRLADVLGGAGAPGEAAEVLQVVLKRNPRFQPALEAQQRTRGETGAATVPAPGA